MRHSEMKPEEDTDPISIKMLLEIPYNIPMKEFSLLSKSIYLKWKIL